MPALAAGFEADHAGNAVRGRWRMLLHRSNWVHPLHVTFNDGGSLGLTEARLRPPVDKAWSRTGPYILSPRPKGDVSACKGELRHGYYICNVHISVFPHRCE
jgi:hypothetical protein